VQTILPGRYYGASMRIASMLLLVTIALVAPAAPATSANRASAEPATVTITFAAGGLGLLGQVTPSATVGTCSASGALGTCVVPAGNATVYLSAFYRPYVGAFQSWSAFLNGPCDGVEQGAYNPYFGTIVLTNPTSDQSCLANFTPRPSLSPR
jgi:hypothetical protein